MADVWAEFIQSQHTSKHSTQSAALEDSASALIQRLEEFGSRSSVRALAERLAAEEAAPDATSPPQPGAARRHVAAAAVAARRRTRLVAARRRIAATRVRGVGGLVVHGGPDGLRGGRPALPRLARAA